MGTQLSELYLIKVAFKTTGNGFLDRFPPLTV